MVQHGRMGPIPTLEIGQIGQWHVIIADSEPIPIHETAQTKVLETAFEEEGPGDG